VPRQAKKGPIQMKILVVDDHALIREALSSVLKELRENADILEASNCGQAMQVVEAHANLDMVVLDLTLPDRSGASILPELRERHPALAIVVLSAVQDRDTVTAALELGAQGFIPKSATREIMRSACQLVVAGGIYVPQVILEREQTPSAQAVAQPRGDRPQISPSDIGLTGRQLDVLALMMQGKSNKAICRVLDLAEPTVKNHVTAILRALKVTNRTEAVLAVKELGWDLTVKS
jgi:DNA-binding NarL/FixJ family response regulator